MSETTLLLIKRWWSLAVLVVFFASGVSGYVAGYRLTSGPNIKRLVALTVSDIPKGADVYIDSVLQSPSKSNVRIFKVLPGNHSLVGNANTFLPWYTLATVPEHDDSLRAFFIPSNVSVTILTGAEATKAKKNIEKYTPPDKNNPLILADGCVDVYVSRTQVIAEASQKSGCIPPPFLCYENACDATIIFSSSERISSVLTYPHRDDALLVSTGRNVYALTLDPREPRVFAPVLQNRAPIVVKNEEGTIVGVDGPTYFSLTFSATTSDL
jgi:hypothetical protein